MNGLIFLNGNKSINNLIITNFEILRDLFTLGSNFS